MIKAIVFDWSGVLAENAVDHMAKGLAKKYSIDEAIMWSALNQYHPKYERGCNYQGYLQKVAAGLKIPQKAIMEWAATTPLRETYALAKRLSKRYRIYLLSDQMHWRTLQIRGRDLAFFKAAFFSSETGYVKSDKKAFTNFLKKTGEKASECLFIDDNANNVKTARSSGFKAVLYSSHENLLKQLKAFDIAIK